MAVEDLLEPVNMSGVSRPPPPLWRCRRCGRCPAGISDPTISKLVSVLLKLVSRSLNSDRMLTFVSSGGGRITLSGQDDE